MAAGDDTVLDDARRRTFGPYTTIQRLGAGGMGTVYAAKNVDGTRVAIKVIRSDFAAEPAHRARFRRDVEAARLIRSDHVARIVDADVDADEPWFAAELVEGPSVADLARTGGPLRVEAVNTLAVALAKAVAALHGGGVIHGDIKPANVVVGSNGAKLVDLGIARPAGSAELTETGMVIGSPQFMAPELRSGGPVGPAVDIYGWAATVVYAATGKPPVDSRADLGVTGTLRRLVTAALSPNPEMRPGAGAVVFDLLDAGTEPDDTVLLRLQDTFVAAATTTAATEFDAGPSSSSRRAATPWSTSTPAPSAPNRRRAAVVLAAVAASILIAVAGILTGADDPDSNISAPSSTTAAEATSSTSTSTTSTTAAADVPDLSIPGFTFDGSDPRSAPSGNDAVGGLRTGMTMTEFESALGPPDRTRGPDGLDPERAWWDLPGGAEVGVGILENDTILDLEVLVPADSPVRAALAEGIILGSTGEGNLPRDWQGADDRTGPEAASAGSPIDHFYSYVFCFPEVDYSDIREFGIDHRGTVASFRTYSTDAPALACS